MSLENEIQNLTAAVRQLYTAVLESNRHENERMELLRQAIEALTPIDRIGLGMRAARAASEPWDPTAGSETASTPAEKPARVDEPAPERAQPEEAGRRAEPAEEKSAPAPEAEKAGGRAEQAAEELPEAMSLPVFMRALMAATEGLGKLAKDGIFHTTLEELGVKSFRDVPEDLRATALEAVRRRAEQAGA